MKIVLLIKKYYIYPSLNYISLIIDIDVFYEIYKKII
jgi:hypothetical protein